MFIYRILSILIYPYLRLYLFYRACCKKEDKFRIKERFGKASKARPEGQIVWIHAVSVGEVNSAIVLAEELFKAAPQISIIFTTTTVTSASIVAKKIPDFKGLVIHQFLPVDSYFCVRRFLKYWRPTAIVFVESEIWPNLINQAYKSDIKLFLVNARISRKSFRNWNLARKLGFNIFDNFDTIFVQNKEDQASFARLSDQQVVFFGNLKSQARSLSCNQAELEKLKEQIGKRKILLAASTHEREEFELISVHQILRHEFPDLLTIIILRHPHRAEDVKKLFGAADFAQRSANQEINDEVEFYLVDTLDELGIFYSIAPFAFIGGSLFEIGGHNPFEAIKLGCAVIAGRGVYNFKEIYGELEKKNACVMIGSIDELISKVSGFLQNEERCKVLSDRAFELIKNENNIAQNIAENIVGKVSKFSNYHY